MTVDDFSNLMFDCSEQLDVNLSTIQPLSSDPIEEPEPKSHEQTEDHRIQSQWKFCLQKSAKNLAKDLLRQDEDRTNLVDAFDLCKIIDRRSQVPQYLKFGTQNQLNDYLGKFAVEGTNKINYKDLIEDVLKFDYMDSTNQVRSAASTKSGLTDIMDRNQPRTIYEDDYIVLDRNKVPQNVSESIE